MRGPKDPVVATLANRSGVVHPYSSVAMSANRKHAIVAGKDTLHLMEVSPRGLAPIRSMRINQHFQTPAQQDSMAKIYEDSSNKQRGSFVRDTFGSMVAANIHNNNTNRPAAPTNMSSAIITDVAWSKPQPQKYNHRGETVGSNAEMGPEDNHPDSSSATNNPSGTKVEEMDSIVAAAGSNGVVVVWSARKAFLSDGDGTSNAMVNQQPEAILSQHTRAVNRLAWHPKRPGLLLTASQDATVKLWVRRKLAKTGGAANSQQLRSWFRFNAAPSPDEQSFSWQCRVTFEPKSEAVRDIRWSPIHDDTFALVTSSGLLIVYNMFVPSRPLVKISAHAGDATTLDWHPIRSYVIATGGAGDRCVKVWDLENSLAMAKDDSNMAANSNTANSRTDSIATESSSETDRSGYASSTIGSTSAQAVAMRSQSFSLLNSSRSKASSVTMLHVLTVSATVTRLKWRPPAMESLLSDQGSTDRHESMLAVATAPIKGVNAGGSGLLGLWSTNRPFMPLSVVDGHTAGAVVDFFWLDTPNPDSQRNIMRAHQNQPTQENRRGWKAAEDGDGGQKRSQRARGISPHDADTPSSVYEKPDGEDHRESFQDEGLRVWQHVLSVGRDGHCLIQSFARGDRPISRVPPSCFAIANKSPFSKGFGSLQICSVHQHVPSSSKYDYGLAGLRQDSVTARAPGVFREIPDSKDVVLERDKSIAGKRLPEKAPELVFQVVDGGEMDGSTPVAANEKAITVAPEVVHLSRFAKGYKLHPDNELSSRVELCLHNGSVAESLQCINLARMWRTVAEILRGSGLDELPEKNSQPENVMQFVLLPTIKSLLLERADAGDVQTCVSLCEVLQVIEPDETTRIPGLSVNLIPSLVLSISSPPLSMNAARDVERHCWLMVISALAKHGENAKVVEEELDYVSYATNLSKGCLYGVLVAVMVGTLSTPCNGSAVCSQVLSVKSAPLDVATNVISCSNSVPSQGQLQCRV
ncbi:GATOR complex protein WDR24 [Seminavis robusta]|uniref:GATOR complex protein WDR24 n=1 Tax=Seminavis robusta TaxID=568900 RepID=A0A9N8DGU9_9STRA|nr:GATOR complex protein WDR24 [Seminavis robusta]|eukprot:Sro83_g044390.1 GATOR complex protein WDR24 (979) ;mRNA; r:67953-71932